MANLTDADKVLRNDTGKDIVTKLDGIINAIQASNIPDADKVVYDNTTSGLTADNVQDAIDEVEGRVDIAESSITSLASDKLDKNNPTSTGALSHTGDATVSGSVTANSGFVGNLTGNVTGDLTGNVTGNVTGNLTGDVTGNLTGTASNATNADTVNNLTVLTAVPANAVFTDTDELANLKDVDFTNLTDGQVIVWNATAGKFSNITLPDPMVFRGTVGEDGTIADLPVDGSALVGDTYKVVSDGTYAGQTAELGDTFICLTKTLSANTWVHIPSGDEPDTLEALLDVLIANKSSGDILEYDSTSGKWKNIDPSIVGTAKGSTATIETPVALPLLSCNVDIKYQQSGSGIPSHTNQRPIIGFSNVIVTQTDSSNTTVDTVTIPLGQTIYGGSVNVKNGTGVRTYETLVLDGTHALYGYSFTSDGYVRYTVNNPKFGKADFVCDYYSDVEGALDRATIKSIMGIKIVEFKDSRFGDTITSLGQWNTWLASNNVTFVYQLQTPVSLTGLASKEFTTVVGTNNFYANSGDTEVKYVTARGESTVDIAEAVVESSSINDLKDVAVSSPSDGQVFKMVGGKWQNSTDNDTTYTLGSSDNNVTLTPSSGQAQSITVPYASNAGTVNSHTVNSDVPSDAKFTDTTYTLGTDGDAVTLTPSSGTAQSITVPYAEKAEEFAESTRTIGNKIPYNFRATNGGYVSDIGDRETDKLIGGSVVFNQLVKNGNFANTSEWSAAYATFSVSNNIVTINPTAQMGRISQGIAFPYGHKMLATLDFKGKTGNTYSFNSVLPNTTGNDSWVSLSKITAFNAQTGVAYLFMAQSNEDDYTNPFYAKNVQVIDLTQMFGSTIADYIYSLEQANTGAGVAYFRKLFPKSYYAYNAGELMSVKTSAHRMVGFNAWDEEWELGTLKWDDGSPQPSTTYFRAKNYIKVLPNTSYYAKVGVSGLTLYAYDENFNFVRRVLNTTSNTAFITGTNECYLRFRSNAESTTYNHDICINISWDGERNGEYEPYEVNTYPLDSDLELRGIPKLDANNNLYYDGDEYTSDGNVKRRYGIVDLSTLDYQLSPSGLFQTYSLVSLIKKEGVSGANPSPYIVAPSFSVIGSTAISGPQGSSPSPNKVMAESSSGILYFNYTDVTTIDAFKTAMVGKYLLYALATPTTEQADAYQNPQIVNDFGTEEYVDTRDVAIPVGHETEYFHYNDREKLDSLPDSANADGIYVVNQTQGKMELNTLLAGLGITLTQVSNGITISAIPAYKDITGTLTAGQTSITLSDASITSLSFIQVFAGNGNINYTSISVATGSVTIGFLAQASDMTVTVRVS